jgi:T5SS/PEP-CTERM-associated repeat protein
VTRAGDVSPPFTAASAVDLSGQQIFIGNTPAGVGTIGTVNVTGGGVLTAAQIVLGNGGLGIGFVNVTGAGSIIHLTGGAVQNGLDIGHWGTGTVNVSAGGLIACSSPLACPFNVVGNAAGSTGTLAVNNGSVTGLGQLIVGIGQLGPGFGTPGAHTSATLSIVNGGLASSTGVGLVAANFGQAGIVTGNVTIDGPGSTWAITRDLANGGAQAGLSLAGNGGNAAANVTISNGGTLSISGSRANPATDNSLPFLSMSHDPGSSSTLTVTTGGSVRFAGDTGVLNVGGGPTSTGGSATVNITAGGTVSGTGANGLLLVDIGRFGTTGVVNISGAGSQLAVAGVGGQNTQGLDGVGGLVLVGANGGVSGALNITGGGSLFIGDNGSAAPAGGVGLRIADHVGVTGAATVSGVGSSVVVSSTSAGTDASPYVIVGNGGDAQMTISDGATVSILANGQRNVIVSNTATGSGVLTMTNGAQIVASRFAIADNGGSGTATLDHSSVNLDGVIFFNGAPIGAGVRVGRGVGANALLTMQNGAVININNTIDSASVILGGTSSLAGGTGTLNMSGASAINFTGTAASASLQVGGTSGTGFMTMAGGSTVNVGATGTATVASTAGSAGTLTVGSGSSIAANIISVGGNSDTAAGGTGTATITGAGSAFNASGANGAVTVGRGGTGSLAVSDQGTVAATSFSVGRTATGFGTLLVDHGVIALSGQQTIASNASGANLSVGIAGGTGIATIANGSVLSITNAGTLGAALNVGGRPDTPGATGNGVLSVTGSQINILAAPGLATARIGYDGNGIATLTSSTMNVGNPTASGADGSLLIAAQPTATGVLSLNAGSVINAGYVGVGATTAGPGGAGTLILNNSTVRTTTFELGAGGLLSGDGGVIEASGDVIIAGTISPGNSPGRVTIQCNLVTLPGSMLVLDILGDAAGFDVDHLRIGNTSTFDLTALHIVFNFLGDTDPNAFAASGGFDLDTFLQSIDPATGGVSGLSTAFAPGQTWEDVVSAANITAVSSAFDISDLHLGPDGTIDVVAIPVAVPEPSTWALMVLGMMVIVSASRRRAVPGRRRTAC